MDKKNIFLGMGLLGAAFLLSFWQGQESQKIKPEAPSAQEVKEQSTSTQIQPSNEWIQAVQTAPIAQSDQVKEELFILENDKIKATFTTRGGALQSIALKDYPEIIESENPLIFNRDNTDPLLSLSFQKANGVQSLLQPYDCVAFSLDQHRILFRLKTPEGLEVLRGYSLSTNPDTPYHIQHETRLVNHSPNPLQLEPLHISLGLIPPVEGDATGEFLNFAYYDGKDAEFVSIHEFENRSGFFGIGQHAALPYVATEGLSLEWSAIKNQFFTCVLTPNQLATRYLVQPQKITSNPSKNLLGLKASMGFDEIQLAPEGTHVLGIDCYVGPKEYKRLESMGKRQELLMQFGMFGFISKLLLALMTAIHEWVPNYGLTIILVTVLIKLLMWPLTAASVRSSRRMANLQEPMKALKERFKDNPQRMQQETMKLFKENRVNPASGCLPILFQIPIFLGLFWMLKSASELRFAPFLWVPDLSLPDTVATLFGFPINILPLLMGASMIIQMRCSPTPATDPMQQKVFQLMPILFLLISYNFPSGLVLYWTAQNVLTILQQMWMRREAQHPQVTIEPSQRAKKSKKVA
jgi:YidC/Oxa1 family membrane protein insertase